MHIIIVGCGRVGSQLAQILSTEGHDVVIIDKDPKAFKRLGSAFNGITLTGVGFDRDLLIKAGVEKADSLAAVTNGDNSNIMVGQVAKRIFNVPTVIARLYDPERADIYKKFGLDTICSTTIGANIIKNLILKEEFCYKEPIGTDAVLIEFPVKEKFAGKKVFNFDIEGEFLVSAISREGTTIIPTENTTIRRKDILIGIAKLEALPNIREVLGLKEVEE